MSKWNHPKYMYSDIARDYHFLQSDKFNNLRLMKSTVAPPTLPYVSETIDKINSIDYTSEYKLYGNPIGPSPSRNDVKIHWKNNMDRLRNAGELILKMLGFDNTTNPSSNKILRSTDGYYKEESETKSYIQQAENNLPYTSLFGSFHRRKKIMSKPKRKPTKCSCKKK